MIIKHKSVKTETTKDKEGKTTTKQTESMDDITQLVVGKVTWEGSRLNVARKLVFSYVQDARDPNLPNYVINCGETVYGYDEDGNLQFQGNVYDIEKDVQQSTVTVTAYDNLFILCRSKTTRKFTDMLAEDIAKAVCSELGIKAGKLAETGKKTSFIAQEKTGYQIIMIAYTDAANQINASKTNKDDPDVLFHPVMRGDELDVIKKGDLIEGMEANQFTNIENSQYRESIEELVDSVMVTDQQGNVTGYQTKDDWIKKYSMVQDVYKTNPNDNAQTEINKLFKGPERSGVIQMLGNYAAKSSYSIQIKDILTELCGKFWIKSDTHTFENGVHEMRLEIEFENIMNKEDKPKETKKATGTGQYTQSEQGAYSYMRSLGFTDNQAAGILGNIRIEDSDYDPAASNGSHTGLFQLSDDDRWPKYVAYCQEHGMEPYNNQNQIYYVTMVENGDLRTQIPDSSPSAAADWFNQNIEISGEDSYAEGGRAAAAESVKASIDSGEIGVETPRYKSGTATLSGDSSLVTEAAANLEGASFGDNGCVRAVKTFAAQYNSDFVALANSNIEDVDGLERWCSENGYVEEDWDGYASPGDICVWSGRHCGVCDGSGGCWDNSTKAGYRMIHRGSIYDYGSLPDKVIRVQQKAQ